MHKQYRRDITATGQGSRHLEGFWSDHWGGLDIDVLEQGLERTDVWRTLRRSLRDGARVLEAGCGPGHWVKFLGERRLRAVGVDLSEPTLVKSRERAPSLPLARADLARLPFTDGAFDAYVSLGVIEHFEEGPEQVLAEARRVVQPGGVFFFSVPYLSWAKRFMLWRRAGSKTESAVKMTFYQYIMTRREIRDLLSRNGFEVLRVHCIEVEGGLQNRLPALGEVKQKLRESKSSLLRRLIPFLHAGWDFLIRLLPAPALAHMVMATCRKPSTPGKAAL